MEKKSYLGCEITLKAKTSHGEEELLGLWSYPESQNLSWKSYLGSEIAMKAKNHLGSEALKLITASWQVVGV